MLLLGSVYKYRWFHNLNILNRPTEDHTSESINSLFAFELNCSIGVLRKMGANILHCLCLCFYITYACYGFPDVSYFYEVPSCSDKLEERDSLPFYDFDRPHQPFDKHYETDFSTAMLTENWKDSPSKVEDIPYFDVSASPQTSFKPIVIRKKRSVDTDESIIEDSVDNQDYDMAILPSVLRQNRNNVKTIHLPASFTPRLGKKRSTEKSRVSESVPSGISGRSHVINLNAGSAFTPRLGRSEGSNKIRLNAGNAFTPRLGRSEDSNTIRFNAGSAFTPRFGRSEDPNRIHFNAGSAFTPRFGRSETPNRILLNAGSAFTPRFGRSENPNRIILNAGSAFTPRFG
ncbi:uncharacterized protein CEXT_238581 [Caerostris extrusa]|uniref:Uncharacterized protein n=1 Tax=Caerostris extrusa TaxID=172846 RepID=A0AAV4XLW7_CAEEX|nr:uncharacterized protein CEXT_238581 [Caerostris extrusa]